jgi:3-hydroxyethyl bacteriochlorophyllide a dehydrogenase
VWEIDPQRFAGGDGYEVTLPDDDTHRDYRAVYDVSGDATIVDKVIERLAPGGEIVLAGFYSNPVSFAFPAAFMREMRLRVAAEWRAHDLLQVQQMITEESLSLDGLITHTVPAAQARQAYDTAFGDPRCLKMIMDWRTLQ